MTNGKPGFALFYTYPWDLHDEGIDAAFRNISEVAHVQEVCIALSYHYSTYFLPKNPVRGIYFGEFGTVQFQPQPELYAKTTMRPQVSETVTGPEYLAQVVAGAKRHGVRISAWIVYCFNQILPKTYRSAARTDALGNPYLSQLCPVNPDVQEYFRALTADAISQSHSEAILPESLSFLPFDYGFWNPKVLTPISSEGKFLLGMCFCPHCVAAAQARGVDAAGLRADVAARLRQDLPRVPSAEEQQPLPADWVGGSFGGRLAAYLAARDERMTAIYEDVVRITRANGADWVDAGIPSRATQIATGLIPDRVRPLGNRIFVGLPKGADDPTIPDLRKAMPPDTRFLASLPVASCKTEKDLVETAERARAGGVDGFTIYNYGLLRQEQIRWIGTASATWTGKV